MKRHRTPVASLLALLTSALLPIGGCAAESGPHDPAGGTASASSAINGGQVDTLHPAVGIVAVLNGWWCTGTLVAPDIVLTDQSCADLAKHPVDGFYLGAGAVGQPPSATMTRYPVASAVSQGDADPWNVFHGLGLLKLSTPVVGTTPAPYAALVFPTPTEATLVGFGGTNTRRAAEQLVRSTGQSQGGILASSIDGGPSGGDGTPDTIDIGAPLFVGGRLVAIVSAFGGQVYCSDIASNRDWLFSASCDGAACLACEPMTCDAVNAACGTAPDGCGGTLYCGGCDARQTCQSGACVSSGPVDFCAACEATGGICTVHGTRKTCVHE